MFQYQCFLFYRQVESGCQQAASLSAESFFSSKNLPCRWCIGPQWCLPFRQSHQHPTGSFSVNLTATPVDRFLPTIPGQQHTSVNFYATQCATATCSPTRSKFLAWAVGIWENLPSLFLSWVFSFSPTHGGCFLHLSFLYSLAFSLLLFVLTLSPVSD